MKCIRKRSTKSAFLNTGVQEIGKCLSYLRYLRKAPKGFSSLCSAPVLCFLIPKCPLYFSLKTLSSGLIYVRDGPTARKHQHQSMCEDTLQTFTFTSSVVKCLYIPSLLTPLSKAGMKLHTNAVFLLNYLEEILY